MAIRTYRQEDEEQVVALWNRVLWADRISADFFRERMFLDPNIDENGIFVFEAEGRPAGLAAAFTRRTDLPWGYEGSREESGGKGFLLPLIAEPSDDANLIRGALLEKAESYLRGQGCREISVCRYGPLFLPNGIDREQYPELHGFFLDSGYRPGGTSYSMRCDLASYRISDEAKEAENKLGGEGVRFRAYRPVDLPAVKRFLLREFPRWISHFAQKVRVKAPGHEIMLAFKDSEVVGYCQYNYYEMRERVGPFGVSGSMRGKNIGQVMVAHLLQTMSEHGFISAYFSSTGERQLKFYDKNGFRVFRTKTVFVKDLQ